MRVPRQAADRQRGVPPPQHNLQTATDLAFAALEGQSPEQLRWLGAEEGGDAWRVRVLGSPLEVRPEKRSVRLATEGSGAGAEVSASWRLLVLHYLGVRERPERRSPAITFAHLPGGRTYASVYEQRVLRRLCATAGRDRRRLTAAAEALGGRPAEGGDAAFDFAVFPRVDMRLIWHAPDEEFPPSAVLLLPENIEELLCIEDIVVLSEGVVARLSGRSF